MEPRGGGRSPDRRRYGVPTHSSVESSKTWCFQIGTSALRVSMRSREAANASPRWAAVVATTTARSPICSGPDAVHRGHTAHVVRGRDPTAHVLEPGERRGVGGVVEGADALAAVVVAHLADEEGEPTGAVVAERVDDLGHVERGLTDGDEAHGVTHVAECRGAGWAGWVRLMP